MTNTEWLALRLSALIENAAKLNAEKDYRVLTSVPGSVSSKVAHDYYDARVKAHRKALLEKSEQVMAKALREIGGAS